MAIRINGDVSVTMFGSHGRFRTEILQAGDVGLHPAGIRAFDRERGREDKPHTDRVQ